jgi:signal transduction histidine kinase
MSRGRLIVVRDVTGQKLSQEMLERAKVELEQTVEERTHELMHANQRLKTELEERKRLEEQLLQSHKLEAMGRLSGGIAHDFNNMLSAILGYTQLMSIKLDPSDPSYDFVEQIEKAANRCSDLTRRLLTFSRRQPIEPRVLSLNDLILDIDTILRRIVNESIEVVFSLDPHLGLVKVDPVQMQQVMMNLVVNARDAMQSGGRLVIETSVASFDEDYVSRNPDVSVGEFAMLSVSDSGVGMEDDVKQHIFEPFFTTKPIGEGTGIGLSMCYGIIKQAEGFITFDSKIGIGTTFQIFLPLSRESEDAMQLRNGPTGLTSGKGRILLAEDEQIVRQMTAEILKNQGYQVTEAKNGEEALSLFRSASEQFDLVISDVTMPVMGGEELMERIRETHPDARFLFVSGYPNNEIMYEIEKNKSLAFLPKPFTPVDLTLRVSEILGP